MIATTRYGEPSDLVPERNLGFFVKIKQGENIGEKDRFRSGTHRYDEIPI
jgi:hypothetical protein